MEIKFTADSMMGGFAKLMRIMGFDVFYSSRMKLDDLIKISKEEDRIFITRRIKYKFPENLRVLRITNNFPHEQVAIVFEKFNLKANPENFLSRCLLCNILLDRVKKEEIVNKVPSFVYKNHNEFAKCPSCERIYWGGTHHKNMKRMVERFYGK